MTIDEITIPQATSSEFQLVCKRTGETFALTDEMLIGQAEDCAITISALKIRRYHAKLSKTEDGLFLEDLNSLNNTYLNGCRIGTGAWVTLGDEINFDGVKFLIESQDKKNVKNDNDDASNTDNSLNIKLHTKPVASSQSSIRPYPLPSVPFSNQDVLEVTRALEARAKERLQLYKEEEAKLKPDWESFITKRPASSPTTASPTATKTTATKASGYASSPITTPSQEALKQKKHIENSTPLTKTSQPAKTPNLDVVKNNNAAVQAKSRVVVSQVILPSLDAANDIFITPDSTQTQHNSSNKPSNKQAKHTQSPSAIASINNVSPEIESDDAHLYDARLVVQTAPTRGKYYLLAVTDAKKVWTIGRAKKADIQLREGSIDLLHAHIELTSEGYKIRTTRTTNGMLINGKLKNEAILKQGDIIQFGRVSFKFQTQIQSFKSTTQETNGTKSHYGIIVGSLIVLGALLFALTQNPL